MRFARLALLLSLAVLPATPPAHAEPAGCVALAAVDPVTPGSCRYVATGPGTYAAATVNQWRIDVSKDGGQTWRFMAGAAFPTTPAAGELDTVAGDLVAVGIAWPVICTPKELPSPTCQKLAREGVVVARDNG